MSKGTIAACNAQIAYNGQQRTHLRFPYLLPMREKIPPLDSVLPAKLLIYKHDASPCVKCLAEDKCTPQACSSALAGRLSIERTPSLCHTDVLSTASKRRAAPAFQRRNLQSAHYSLRKTSGHDRSTRPSDTACSKPDGFQCPLAGLPMASTSPLLRNRQKCCWSQGRRCACICERTENGL